MRVANGIVLDKDTTFGELKFSALPVSYTHLRAHETLQKMRCLFFYPIFERK